MPAVLLPLDSNRKAGLIRGMLLPPDLDPPHTPSMGIVTPSEQDRGEAFALMRNFEDMRASYFEVVYALALFQAQEEEFGVKLRALEKGNRDIGWPTDWMESHWMFLAARYGALAVRNFGQALAAVTGLIGLVPSWAEYIDRKGVGMARKRFDASFPDIDKLRHAVAHPEYFSDPNKADYVRVENDLGGSIMLQSSLEGRKLSYTFNKVVVSYELTVETLEELVGITNDCFGAFHPPKPGPPPQAPTG